jgi:hypothetical protein
MKDVIPRSLSRRVIVALLGYHYLDGVWSGPGPDLTEEQLDRMTAAQWSRYLRRWSASAAATN